MKIAIDCRSITDDAGEMAGIGHYTFSLVRHLLRLDDRNRYVLFVDKTLPKHVVTDLLGSSQRVEVRRIGGTARHKIPYLGSHRMVAKAVAREKADIFHSTSGSLPMGYKGKSVLTVHDLAIYLHPEWFPGGQFFSKRFVVPSGLRKAERVICVSASTRRDLMKLFPVPEEKIAVVHEGVEFHAPEKALAKAKGLRERYGLDRPYFMSLGTLEPRKNLTTVIDAYVALTREFPYLLDGTELILAGAEGWKTKSTRSTLKHAEKVLRGTKARIRHVGYVAEKDKWGLMADAVAFLFPSLYEGFGLPVLEAMSLGVPVVASESSSIPEITGRHGAILADPNDRSEWVLAMKHLLEDPIRRAEVGRRGLERATEFSWRKTAGETLEVYQEAFKDGVEAEPGANLRHEWMDSTFTESPHRPL